MFCTYLRYLPLTTRHFLQSAHIVLLSVGLPAALLLNTVLKVNAAVSGPALAVDPQMARHPISPNIYGISFFWGPNDTEQAAQLNFAKAINLPLNRSGGDATSRYNWQVDSTNAGIDFFYDSGNFNQANPLPSASMDYFIDTNRSIGTQSVITIPVIEYITKSSIPTCSFLESVYGPQQSFNPYFHPNGDNCGNGVSTSGQNITDTHVDAHDILNAPSIQQAWVQHLVNKYGTGANGGVQIYQMDNEPHNWSYLHRDVHPQTVTEDEIVSQNIAYAQVVKTADPTAKVAGPSEIQFAWYPDYGGDNNTISYLQQLKAYDLSHGGRLIDYFDVHYPDANDNHYPNLTDITHLRQVVDQTYPGTGISVSEWTGGGGLQGALFTADELGLYAQNEVAFASNFGLDIQSPAAYVYMLYLNYDGNKSMFGKIAVQSSSDNTSQLSIYAAQRSNDGALTMMIINKTGNDLSTNLNLHNFSSGASAQVYTYSGSNLTAIVRQPDLMVSPSGFTATYPASSITLIVLPKGRLIHP